MFSHIRYRALGPELIPVYRHSAGPENVSVRRTLSVSALEVLYGINRHLLTYLLTYRQSARR